MGLEWLGGVALSLVGNVLNNLGTNLMKLGHNKCLKPPVPHAAYKESAWLAGLVLYGIGTFAMFYSFGYAAQSILAALGCIQFISNIIFAATVLKEKVTRQVLAATGLIVIGCVLLVVFGSHSSESFDVAQLLDLYKNPAYIAYLVVGSVAAAGSFVLYWFGNSALKGKHTRLASCWAAALPVLFSVFSALVCTQSLVFNKAVMVLWRMTLDGQNQFNKWQTWLMAIAFLVTSGLWVFQINKGLQAFPALIIVPCLQLCWTLFGVVCGLLYFQEYVGMTQLQVAMFVLGVGIVCAGAAMLASASQTESNSIPAAQHAHADQEVQAPLQELACASVNPAAAAAVAATYRGAFSLAVWQASNDVSRALPELCPVDYDSSDPSSSAALQPAGGSMPLVVSYVPPAAAPTGLLPTQGSLDAAGLTHMTRRGNRRMSRLRTVSLPR